MSFSERRKYERRPYVKPLRYYLKASHMDKLKVNEIENEGVSFDISEGGIGMITHDPLNEGDILFFKDEIKVNGFAAKSSTVRWAREIEESRCRVGLKFVR